MKIQITAAHIETLRTPAGGYNKQTMELLGVWPLTEGWKERLIGLSISDRVWRSAIKAKDIKRHIYRGNTRRA